MPRVKKDDAKPRTPAQLANDERLRNRSASFHVSKNLLGADDVDPPQSRIDISTSGPAEATRIDVIPADRMQAKAEDEAFMNEMVEIQIESSDDPTEALFVPSGHNGVPQFIQRGVPQSIKRKFLYSLIAAKSARLVCAFGRDGSGQEFNRLQGPSSCTHRVTVIRDSERGRQKYREWLQQL